jgi:RNA polymerase sigma factor (sigma-70 family)
MFLEVFCPIFFAAVTIYRVNISSDQKLLADYAARRSEAAFTELVRRHVDLVYSAALRMVRDAHLAEDVAQGVFTALAQNAGQLADRPVLSGWLHRTAQNIAANTVRSEVRRRAREQEAVLMNEILSADSGVSWQQIAPHLDTALGELSEADREAVLLRYFEKKTAQEMGETLGLSAEAAQKRVNRAVEKLREHFTKRRITVGATGLVVLISANAVQSAPVGLAVTISTAAALTGTTLATAATVTATKAIAMTALQKTIVTATIAALAGVGIYEARKTELLKDQVEALQQQIPSVEYMRKLQSEHDDAMNRLTGLADELAYTKKSNLELLKLRAEVGLLRQQTNRLGKLAQALSTTLASANSLGTPLKQTNFPRESWTFAGLATPDREHP